MKLFPQGFAVIFANSQSQELLGYRAVTFYNKCQQFLTIAYIENSLCGDPDPNKAAAIACVSTDTFLRFFSYITGMTLTDYIRKRRLTLAAQDLTDADDGVADLAVKYGYDSASAFSRAFAKQHGITPSAYRKNGGSLRIVPPVSFHICIKGAEEMDFRMIELNETKLYGISRKDEGYRNREELRHLMWSEEEENIPCRICAGRWNQPGCTSFDGEWYGICVSFRVFFSRYMHKSGIVESYGRTYRWLISTWKDVQHH